MDSFLTGVPFLRPLHVDWPTDPTVYEIANNVDASPSTPAHACVRACVNACVRACVRACLHRSTHVAVFARHVISASGNSSRCRSFAMACAVTHRNADTRRVQTCRPRHGSRLRDDARPHASSSQVQLWGCFRGRTDCHEDGCRWRQYLPAQSVSPVGE